MAQDHQIIRRAILTEKGSKLRELSNSQVLFEVAKDSNKIEIGKAVALAFGVRVIGVRTLMVRGKMKRVGRWVGKRPNWKKAIVTLAPGEKIDFLSGAQG